MGIEGFGWEGCRGGPGTNLEGLGWYGRSEIGMVGLKWKKRAWDSTRMGVNGQVYRALGVWLGPDMAIGGFGGYKGPRMWVWRA